MDGLSIFGVSSVCWSSRSQSLDGKVLSAMHLMEMKCDFVSWMDLSAGSCRWSSGEASCIFKLSFCMVWVSRLETSLSDFNNLAKIPLSFKKMIIPVLVLSR